MNSHIIQANSLTAVIDGEVHTVERSHPRYDQIKDAITAGDWQGALEAIDIRSAVMNYVDGVEVIDDAVYFNGNPVHNVVCDRILEFMDDEEVANPLIAFLERLMNNPSKHSVDQLYSFLENRNIPIDHEGYIVAYKSVRKDWKDIHSGTFDNRVGTVNEMPRNNVDDNPNNHCSQGFHVGALGYVRDFGGTNSRIVICRVDPADVVSVPNDHNCQKMRVSKYEVIGEYTGKLPSTVYDPSDNYNNNREVW